MANKKLTLQQAREKHRVDIMKGLSQALEIAAKPGAIQEMKEQQLLKDIPADAGRDFMTESGIFRQAVLGKPEFETDAAGIIRTGKNMGRLLHRLDDEANKTLERIRVDPEIDNGVRMELINELAKHGANVGTLAVKIENMKAMPVLRKNGHDVDEWGFKSLASMLEDDNIVGNEERALEYSRMLYKKHPKSFFRLSELALQKLEGAGVVLDRLEDVKSINPSKLKKGGRAYTFARNVLEITTSEKVRKFLQQEKDEALKEWGLEPFGESKDVVAEAQKVLDAYLEELTKKGVRGDKRGKVVMKKVRELDAWIDKQVAAMVEKEGKKSIYLDRHYKIPIEKERGLRKAKPAVLFHWYPEKKRERPLQYHV